MNLTRTDEETWAEMFNPSILQRLRDGYHVDLGPDSLPRDPGFDFQVDLNDDAYVRVREVDLNDGVRRIWLELGMGEQTPFMLLLGKGDAAAVCRGLQAAFADASTGKRVCTTDHSGYGGCPCDEEDA